MPKKLIFFLLITFSLLFSSCSTQKNTLATRAYHNLTAHYNVFFNAKMALLDAQKQIQDQCQINYFNLLPVFTYECPNAASLAKAKLNRVLEKAAKTIRNHSITAKPSFRNQNNLSPAQIAFLKKKEYNKWIDDSYLLIGIANLYKGDIQKSQRALHKILQDFKEENTRFDANLWLIRSYIIQGRYLDAQKSLKELEADLRRPKRLNREILLTWADLYIHMKQYDKAIDYLTRALKLIKNRQQKAKYTYLLAQLYMLQDDRGKAAALFKKVPHYNPPYVLEFHAQLMRATTLASDKGSRQIRRKLLKMLKDEKNEEYKDKIYYALGQTYLKQKDTAQALKYLKLGAGNSQDNLNKALIYNQIADLYFSQGNYILSGAYYDSTLTFLPKDYDNYDRIRRKSANLIELAKNYQEIKTQDSLLRLASLPQKKLYAIIDSIIQAKKEQQQNISQPTYDPFDIESQRYASGMQTTQSQGGKWYFYNPVLVSRGQQLFRQRWGNRRLEDNWRRKNKSVITGNLGNEQIAQKQEEQEKNSREFYLKQIPLTDSAKQVANDKIIESWFNIAQIFEEKIQNLDEAEKTYQNILKKYPDNKYLADIYYHLYLIYKLKGDATHTLEYKRKILTQFPRSRYARLLLSPDLANEINEKQQRADQLLLNVIDLYNNYKYTQVIDSVNYALKNLSGTTTIPNLLFLKAKAFGGLNMIDSLKSTLEQITTNYPDAEITQQAQKLLSSLTSGNLNINIYKFTPQAPHYIVVFLSPSDNINEMKFNLFKLANEFYKDKQFQVSVVPLGKQHILVLRQFDNMSNAKEFLGFLQHQNMFKNSTMLLFSDQNFKTFTQDKNLFKYKLFYAKFYNF